MLFDRTGRLASSGPKQKGGFFLDKPEDFDCKGKSALLRRRDERDSLFLLAPLRNLQTDIEQTVRVRNLSAHGMMADDAHSLANGDRIETTLRGIGIVTGHVAWVAKNSAGISFDEPVEPKLARKPISGDSG